MGRLVRLAVAAILTVLAGLLGACGSSGVKSTNFPVPSNIGLSPAGPSSMDLGANLTFAATPRDSKGNAISEPVSFLSSNPAVLTIAANGNACAGSWDSLVLPQICTPGPVGVAQITATAKGVSSPPTTVYVHQHIDNIAVVPLPRQTTPTPACFSKGQTFNFQATAYNRGQDITDTVGDFTWQVQNTTVAGLAVATQTTPINGLLPGQVQVTAKTPGVTSFFASVSNVVGIPFDFTTCPVQSIELQVNGTDETTVNVPKATSVSVTPVVLDSRGIAITGVPLTWCSSHPGNVAVGTNCATNTGLDVTATTPLVGGGTVTASCTPPNCNIGLAPTPNPNKLSTMPIYPENAIRFVVAAATATAQTATVYASSTGCQNTIGCISTIIPITSPSNTLGDAINLPATPNSMAFDPTGTNLYLGTDFSFLDTQGLMKVAFGSSVTVAQFKSVTGKILTISPDGKKVIVSDTQSNPNQVFIVDTASSSVVPLAITGATAADFSPDALKAYIAAGNSLYVYSTIDPLIKLAPVTGPVNDVSFLANGAFAYVAGGVPSGVTAWTNCTDTIADSISTTSTPVFLKTLADASGMLAVVPPNIDIISVNTTPKGCPPQAPVDGPVTSFSLGQGPFVPSQLIASTDGQRVYLLTDRFGSVLVFDIDGLASSSIALTGSPLPLHATLTPDGTLLYVAANDGTVHVLDTHGAGDLVQITFPSNPATLLSGLCSGVTFPQQSVVNISAASQNGSTATTAYTYTLTSGPALDVGATVVIQGMTNAANNGVFVITAVGSGTFTVVNANGVTAGNQSGTGNVSINCNPDLVVVKP